MLNRIGSPGIRRFRHVRDVIPTKANHQRSAFSRSSNDTDGAGAATQCDVPCPTASSAITLRSGVRVIAENQSSRARQIDAAVCEALRQKGTITAAELREHCQLTDQVESADADRLKHLADLAKLRMQPLEVVMRDLEIPVRKYA